MADVPFHATRMGQKFYDHTMPGLVQELARIAEALEKLAPETDHQGTEEPGSVPDDLG